MWGVLTYDTTKFSVYSYPGGPSIQSGTEIPLTPAETLVYVMAADPNAAQPVSGDLTLSGGQFTSVTLNTCYVDLEFDPLQLTANDTPVTNPANADKVPIGQQLTL